MRWIPNKIAFTLGPLTVNWYGVLIAAAGSAYYARKDIQ